ncbi:RNA-binding protein YlmH, contains S4-like domain [Oceanobacillus limi]|uniref:RNA-binding protein YlmH, contains S4-like domain n=1 Tax=Oceanobacillus limi TaxID=930131 RepID=A0A1I0DEC5_9BACI|nr:RNA-binding protein [Oceanobacillus limi]SET30705.1 RNA-binding protein YlmH, contains S4-like domain [Oceanobacillus limi]
MDIYQHFRKDEHDFIDQVLSWKEEVERSYQRKITDFLDPREQQIVEMIIGTSNEDVIVKQFGGGSYSERKRVIIAPYYEEIEKDDFQLCLLQASYPEKFIRLSHRDVMGAFLSLGMKRKKLGDIVVKDGIIQLITSADIALYVSTNLTSIKKASLQLEEIPLDSLTENKPDWKETEQTVSSLRLDNVLKEIYNISRKVAQEFIQKKYVKVNYKLVEDGKFILQEDDLISLRGKGRSKLLKVNGYTKKEKIRITTALLRD